MRVTPDDSPMLAEEERRHWVHALETLPSLTRTVFLLASRDALPDAEICWRCGMCVEEVQVRLADALITLDRNIRSGPTFIGRARRALLPWREAWAKARASERDRRLAPWFGTGKTGGRRSVLQWLAWAFERTLR